MSSPIEKIFIGCPKCGLPYDTYIRRSMNLRLDHFDDDYIEEMSTGTCPYCGYKVDLDTLVVSKDGTFLLPDDE